MHGPMTSQSPLTNSQWLRHSASVGVGVGIIVGANMRVGRGVGRSDMLGFRLSVGSIECVGDTLGPVGLSDGKRFALGLTQADISEICGITSVHTNRVLRQLREERLCIFRSSLVEILDVEGLARRGQFNPAYLYIETISDRSGVERLTS